MLLQGFVVSALVVVPLLAMQSLPDPQSRWSIGSYVPVVPTPSPSAPPTAPRTTTPRVVRPPSAAVFDTFIAPAEVPTGIFEESSLETGVPFGVPSGVEGSIGAPVKILPAVAAPPTPAAPGPVRPGVEVGYPKKIHHVEPIYPRLAREARKQGVVKLETTIDIAGNVVNLRVVESVALLDAAAIEAVRQWRYEPSTLNGQPVPVLFTVDVIFRLSR